MTCALSEDSDQTGHPSRLISPRYALCRLLRTQAFFMRTVKTLDQTGRMPRLIRVFAGRTGHFVGFVVLRLIFTT